MARTTLGLPWVVLGCLALGIGCASQTRPGDDSGVVLFGAVADVYTVCIHVSSDATQLEPSVVCDPEGVTPYSFNILVEQGTDGQGEPCGSFRFTDDAIVPLGSGGTFTLTRGTDSDSLRFIITGTLTSGGSVESGTGEGTARVEIEVPDADVTSSCEVVWNASAGPVCFEDAATRCNLLLTCCQSILLLPPLFNECMSIVDACDPDVCEQTLSGYPGCPQPPICPPADDPDELCTDLNECCNTVDIDKEELIACLDTAEACIPEDCEALLETYPECEPPPE